MSLGLFACLIDLDTVLTILFHRTNRSPSYRSLIDSLLISRGYSIRRVWIHVLCSIARIQLLVKIFPNPDQGWCERIATQLVSDERKLRPIRKLALFRFPTTFSLRSSHTVLGMKNDVHSRPNVSCVVSSQKESENARKARQTISKFICSLNWESFGCLLSDSSTYGDKFVWYVSAKSGQKASLFFCTEVQVTAKHIRVQTIVCSAVSKLLPVQGRGRGKDTIRLPVSCCEFLSSGSLHFVGCQRIVRTYDKVVFVTTSIAISDGSLGCCMLVMPPFSCLLSS